MDKRAWQRINILPIFPACRRLIRGTLKHLRGGIAEDIQTRMSLCVPFRAESERHFAFDSRLVVVYS
ncbi:hypothetical protein BaRGS_00026330, partial [Batillaria attramentaria]